MGRQLDSGAPNPVLWDEICVVNDLILCSFHGAVQGCGRVMGLRPPLGKMRETSTLRKQEDEALNLCLPHRQVPCPPQAGQQSFAAAAAVRAKQGGVKAQRTAPAGQQANQRP
ncbi:hypothetical protein SRHO_G00287370 [Serrasalmus rhombeus]